jgi:hypothetical protein
MDIRDLALSPGAVIVRPGEEYHSASRKWFQGIPAIERSPGGRLWAAWYSGGCGEGSVNYVVLATSSDDGESWSEPVLVIDPPGLVRAFDQCLWHDPHGRLWLFWCQSHEWFDGRAGVFCIRTGDSDRETPQWTEPRRIADGVMMNKPTALSADEWLLPVAVWHFPPTPPADPPPSSSISQCDVLSTKDGGETFCLRGGASLAAGQKYEHMIVERMNGDLWMLMRAVEGIGESSSTDRGKTWSPGRATDLACPDTRFFVRRLHSGKLLLVNHHDYMSREGEEGFHRRNNLTAFLSDDDGASWTGGLVLDERFQVSYPDGVQAEDGRIYIIYDHERTGCKEILMAVFREEDISAGKPVSADARLKVLVNRAG